MNATGCDASIRQCFRRMSQIQWALTAATLAAVVLLVARSPIRIDATETSSSVIFGAVFGAVGLFYTYARFDLKVATFCDGVAQLCLFVMIGGSASYVATHYGVWSAFRDADFLAIDRAFGLDWLAYLHLVSGHPLVASAFDVAYRSLPWQAVLLAVVLSATGRSGRLQTFVLAFQIGALCCIVVSALVPAVGTYRHLGVTAMDHPGIPLAVMDIPVAAIMQLRGDAPMISLKGFEGVVTFPSMHTTLAILFAWGFRGVPGLRWFALAFNLTMLLATPLWGSHYFVDLAGGAVVAAIALATAVAIRRRVEQAGAKLRIAVWAAPVAAQPSPAG